MKNINKKQNLVEQARINLDKEKILHQVTLARVEKLETIIKEAREYMKKQLELLPHYMYEAEMYKVLEILDKVDDNK